jgi:ABC-2 type transport system ATP-binding protein
MRELVRELRRMGKTILVSSHILPELEELCTWVGFIDAGRMVAAGPMAEVRSRVLAGRRLRVELVDADAVKLNAARDQVSGRPGVVDVQLVDDALEVAVEDDFADQDLLLALVQAGVAVRSFAPVAGDLAEAFMRLTGPAAVERV